MNKTMANKKLRLRPWQKKALDQFMDNADKDFLTVATPGAGKTTFALTAARLSLPTLPGGLVIVVPTRHLKEQWADAAQRFGLHLAVDWSAGERLPPDVHGVVTTYQQVGSSAAAFFSLSQGGFAIFDEVHHAGDERTWGEGIRAGFDAASKRLSLSGTPFRSDTQAIPFVRYEHNEVVPDFEYGYADALADGRVVRSVYFPRFGGHMEWTAPDGAEMSASFDDPLVRSQANQRLRAALSLNGDWLPTVLGHANDNLLKIRKRHPDAGALVIAMDQEHARGISKILRTRFGVSAEVVISEDPKSSEKISAFNSSSDPWVVAVRMISEGVDIPRLRVGVYATTTTTELFFRQAVGRIVRHQLGGGRQRSYMFIPDDYRLRRYGIEIAESRNHSLERKSSSDEIEFDNPREAVRAEDQMSLFEVHSATVDEVDEQNEDIFVVDSEPDLEEDRSRSSEEDSEMLVIDLAALPAPMGGSVSAAPPVNDRKERERLRRVGQNLASELVGATGMSHASVNAELNRRSGIRKTAEASIMQLMKRSRMAETWLRQEQRRKRSVPK